MSAIASVLVAASALPAGAAAATPAPTPPVVGTRWVIESILDRFALLEVPAELGAYVIFEPGGTLDAYATCNWLSGRATVGADTVELSGIGMTKRGCENERLDLELRIVAALDDGTVEYEADGDQLILSRPDAPTLVLRADPTAAPQDPADPAPLLETRWDIVEVFDLDVIYTMPDDVEAYLVLHDDGSVEAYDTCNWYRASASVGTDTITMTDVVWTERACWESDHLRQILMTLISRFLSEPRPMNYRIEDASGRLLVDRDMGTRFGTGLTLRPATGSR